jgi:hypothetical protein
VCAEVVVLSWRKNVVLIIEGGPAE